MADPAETLGQGRDADRNGEARSLSIKRSYLKMGAFVFFVGVCLGILHFTPLRQFVSDLQSARSFLLAAGYKAPLVFVAVAAASIFVGAPRLPFCVLAGMLFGFAQGLVLSQLASLTGAYGPFLLGRYSAQAWVKKRLAKIKMADDMLANPTIFHVFMLRQIPAWGVLINLFLGSIGVSHLKFMVGSLLGFLPQGIIFTLVGGGIAERSFLQAFSKVFAAVSLLAIAAYVTWRWISRSLNRRGSHKL